MSLPVVGIGGITSAKDALEFILAGATAVAVGTANFTRPTTMLDVIEGLKTYVETHHLDSIIDVYAASLEEGMRVAIEPPRPATPVAGPSD